MNCITTRLIGGLGNQMFQYAAGRALSVRTGLPLMLDITALSKRSHRDYDLGAFKLEARTFRRPGEGKPDFLSRAAMALHLDGPRPASAPIYTEPHFHYDQGHARLSGPCVLDGYWQSERYFMDIAGQIRQEFVPSRNDHRVHQAQARLQSPAAVSLHIRRGDYVSNPEVARFHGLCDLDYYRQAMDTVLAHTPDAVFHVFSDDPAWVQAEFPRGYRWELAEDWSNKAPWVDLWLMSRCSHHIIANSSYSWWGAWLNPSTEKRVIAPARWFKEANHDTSDILPASWIRLD